MSWVCVHEVPVTIFVGAPAPSNRKMLFDNERMVFPVGHFSVVLWKVEKLIVPLSPPVLPVES
jgi:hypothetical protein